MSRYHTLHIFVSESSNGKR